MKIIIAPIFSNPKKIRVLKRDLKRSGFLMEKEVPERGELGRGIATGLATILSGGQTVFTKLGDALIKHIENKKVDLVLKNGKGEEITLSATLPKDELRGMMNDFFGRKISTKPPRKKIIKKTPAKKTPLKKDTTKKVIAPKNKTKKKVK